MVRSRDDIYSRSQDVEAVLTRESPLALTGTLQTIDWDSIEVFANITSESAGELTIVGDLHGKRALHSIIVNVTGPTPTFAFSWDYIPSSAGNPSSGEAKHSLDGATIRFHEEDNTATDRSAELDLVTPGWRIQLGIGGTTYAVTATLTAGSVYHFDVVPTTFATAGVQPFRFLEPMPNPTLEIELQQDKGSGFVTLRRSKEGNGSALQGTIIQWPTLLETGDKFRVQVKDDTATMTTVPLGVSWSIHVLL